MLLCSVDPSHKMLQFLPSESLWCLQTVVKKTTDIGTALTHSHLWIALKLCCPHSRSGKACVRQYFEAVLLTTATLLTASERDLDYEATLTHTHTNPPTRAQDTQTHSLTNPPMQTHTHTHTHTLWPTHSHNNNNNNTHTHTHCPSLPHCWGGVSDETMPTSKTSEESQPCASGIQVGQKGFLFSSTLLLGNGCHVNVTNTE